MDGRWEDLLALEYRLHRVGESLPSPAASSKANRGSSFFAGGRRESPVSTISVIARGDGAVAIERGVDSAAELLSEIYRTPVVFRFRTPGAAEVVMAGARRRLANERIDESDFWYLHASAGHVAAAIKTEAKSLCYAFAIVHPYLKDAPTVGTDKKRWKRRAAAIAPYALSMSAGGMIGLIAGFLLKGF